MDGWNNEIDMDFAFSRTWMAGIQNGYGILESDAIIGAGLASIYIHSGSTCASEGKSTYSWLLNMESTQKQNQV
jgi:hypothetical protein